MTVAGGIERKELATFTVADLAWALAAGLFVLLRLGPVWQAPVGGAELDHLSGAWQASIGTTDARFVPTFFQAICALLFQFTTSEVPARVVAFVGTASIPVAVYMLRGQLGNAGGVIALTLLAFDAPGIALGVSASAMAFDIALAMWLFVTMARRGTSLPPWADAVAAFMVVTAGALVLPLLLAAGGLALYRRDVPSPNTLIAWGAGALLGLALTFVHYGLGVDGVAIAPIITFEQSFEREWSGAPAMTVVAMYSIPILVGGIAALGWQVVRWRRGEVVSRESTLLPAWFAIAAGWLVAAAGSDSTAAVVAATTPAALLGGPALVRGIEAMIAAEWRYARILLPIAGLSAAVATNICLEWADRAAVGSSAEQTVVVLLYTVALIACAAVCAERRAIPTLVAAGLAIAAVPFAAGGFGVALSAVEEPIPAPVSPVQAAELRRIAFETLEDKGGTLVVHPDLAESLLWPFRDSGNIQLSSRVPGDATFVVWPLGLPAPEGMVPLEGEWALLESVEPPDSLLDYVRWLSDRNELAIIPLRVAVYTEASE
ncbi:MAG TPA: hypothetical protein VFK32_07480 [Tepidiformaceae bacterium]|nr:hypothetical protein [Tepidiformaceae bacterium]